MKRLRFYIVHYQPIYTGAGKSLEKLLNSIDKENFSIEIITSYKKGLKREEIVNGYKIIRTGYSFFNNKGYLNPVGKIIFMLSSMIYNLINRDYNTIIFIGIGTIAIPSILVSKIFKKKIVNKITAVGDDDPSKMKKSFLGKFIIWLLKNDAHWVISKEIEENCFNNTNWNRKKIYLIPNPVEVKYLSFSKIPLRQKTKKLKFLFVGVLDNRKGVDVLLNLWLTRNIDADLLLCGPRGDDININKLLEDCKNEINIFELGELAKQEIEIKYLESDYFIFPSTREGLPNVVLEAMSFGLPVIANKIKGVTDYLLGKNERGILVKDNNIGEFYYIIQNIIESEDYRDALHIKSQLAHKWILNNAESTIVKNKLEKIFTGCS
jgi:glycosyltransferase involved in cell wall biosynthesis